MSAAVKYKESIQATPDMIPTGIMAGNENVDFSDNGGSVSRRRVDWYFGNPPTVVDAEIPAKLAAELAGIILLCNRCYLTAVNRVRSGRVWDYLPRFFHAQRIENQEQTNSLIHFLNNGPLQFAQGQYMQLRDFTRATRRTAASTTRRRAR